VRRGRLDAFVQEGRPHLVVSGLPTGWEIGPFVVPGRTACLRCVDAARAETDPRRAVVADQLARAAVAAPVSPAAQAAALALAVREVVAYVDGDVPATWSATLSLGATGPPSVTRWARHPLCGCAWDVVLAADLR
jgi:bacteriocin biosynthesis cyclodehydratase domain-containing protein